MSAITTIAVLAALLGSALIAGVFFAFSSFIMKALSRVPAPEGIAAMQSINRVVLNPTFLGAFLGTAVISGIVVALAIEGWGAASTPYMLSGGLSYLVGTFLVTGLGNVPLNNRLGAASATDPEAVPLWEHYLERWTMLNTIRTVAASTAVLMFTVALMQSGGA